MKSPNPDCDTCFGLGKIKVWAGHDKQPTIWPCPVCLKKPEITIEKHTPIDGDYYLIDIDGALFAKTWKYEDALKIKKALEMEVNNA